MLFLHYIAPPDFSLEVVRNKHHAMIIVGGMGSGKTTWTLSVIARAAEELLNQGKDDGEIAVVHALETSMKRTLDEIKASLDLERISYLYWFSDDAPAAEGQHGRRAMSKENVAESQFYAVIRHRLERLGFDGFMFVAHATQVYNLIDVTFRRLAKIKAFKDYPDEPSDLKIIGPMLGRTYLRKLADITYKIWSPKSREELIEGLSTAVVRFIRKRKTVRVDKRGLPPGIEYIKVEPEDTGEDGIRDTSPETLEYIIKRIMELRQKRYLVSKGRYLYLKVDGKEIPFIKRDIAEQLGII